MDEDAAPDDRTLAQLGHHIGLHVTVNLEGKTVGSVLCEAEQWVPGVIVGMGALGDSLTIKLDAPVGGQDLVSIDDRKRVRAQNPADVQPAGTLDEIAALARAGKTKQAIKRYRALNGATLDEARAYTAEALRG